MSVCLHICYLTNHRAEGATDLRPMLEKKANNTITQYITKQISVSKSNIFIILNITSVTLLFGMQSICYMIDDDAEYFLWIWGTHDDCVLQGMKGRLI